ncbi:MAG: CRISPR-associated RAMP protein Csx7 [Nitrososphaerales archaeon]
MSYGNFHILNSIYNIELELENITPLSICSGKEGIGAVDNPIVKRDGIPYIPGSTLKGVLRSEAERYARHFGSVCDILNPSGENGELTLKKSKEKGKQDYKPCIICRIFGGPTYASHIYIYDAKPIDKKPPIGVRRRVSINRVLGAHHSDKLFDIEYVEPGCKWATRIKFDNIDPLKKNGNDADISRIVKYIFELLHNEQLSIGGKRSIGLGLIKADIKKVYKLTIEDNRLKHIDVTKEFIEFIKSEQL